MRVLLAQDSRFLVGEGGTVYAPATFAGRVWDRYLKGFDEVRALGRVRGEPWFGGGPSYHEPISRDEVSFGSVPDVRTGLDLPVRQRRLYRISAEEVGAADAVIAKLPSETGLAAIHSARSMGKPWAVEMAGCAWDGLWNYGGLAGKLYAPIMWYRVRRVVKHAPFVLYVTERFLQRRYPCGAGHTVACSNVELPPPSKEALERRLACLDQDRGTYGELVFGLIGSLHGRFKGIQTALKALGRVRDELPPFRFRVLGVGDPAPWREAAARHGVADITSFDGTLPGGEPVLEWLDRIDVYLQPSLREGLPRALIEAMSRGCPAVGSSVAGIPELLEPEALVRPGNAHELGRVMVRSAHDPNWRRRQATRNWEKAGEYSRDVLEPRRQAFWERFSGYARTYGCGW